MIEVFHLNDELFFNGKEIDSSSLDKRYYNANIGLNPERQSQAVIELFNEGYYTLVAKVDTNELEHAWQQTNNIDDSWTKNPNVEAMIPESRSSKVGDVMKDSNGTYHIVASIGFTAVQEGAIKQSQKKLKM